MEIKNWAKTQIEVPYTDPAKLKDFFYHAKWDWNGHLQNGKPRWTSFDEFGWMNHFYHEFKNEEYSQRLFVADGRSPELYQSCVDRVKVLDAWEKGEKLDSFVPFYYADKVSHPLCKFCKTHKRRMSFDDPEGRWWLESNGQEIRIMPPCESPEGLIRVVELNVPSGQIVANDLLNVNKHPDLHDINTMFGRAESFSFYGTRGQINLMVRDTEVCRTKNGTYALVSKIGKKPYNWIPVHDYAPFEYSFNAMDRDAYLSLCKLYKEEPDEQNLVTFDVEPGVYRFEVRFHDHYDKPVKMRFKRVRKPDPVEDFAQRIREFQPTAGQIVAYLSSKEQKSANYFNKEDHPVEHYRDGCVAELFNPWLKWGHGLGYPSNFTPEKLEAFNDAPAIIPRLKKDALKGHGILDTCFGGLLNPYYLPDLKDDIPNMNSSIANAALKFLEAVYYKDSAPEAGNPFQDPKEVKNAPEILAEMHKRCVIIYRKILSKYPDADFDMKDFTEIILSN